MADLPFTDVRETGDLVFVSGKIHLGADMKLKGSTPREKTIKALENIEKSLGKVGLTLSDIVFCQIFVTDMDQYEEVNDAYMRKLPKPYPARALAEVSRLPLGADIEIVATASRNNES